MSVGILAELVAAASAYLAVHGVAEPGPARFDQLIEDHDRLFVAETVYEGYLMHYGTPRAFRGMDEDLRLLAGDTLYALGLSRLAEQGDLEAIAELSDLISLCAQAHAEGRPELGEELWQASARALSEERGPGARAWLGDRLPAARQPPRL